uniref:Pro-apoptotic WT1 regulator n=1 Tax=Meleagris gallopavo TaxID=9103 RepID=G1NEU0_MELGA
MKSLDEYEDDEAGQKERKKEDAITQQNTIQNESSSADSTGSYLIQDSSRMVSSRYKSTGNAPEDDALNRYSRTDRTTYSRYSRDANSSGSSVPSNALEKRIEELERELAKERQENVRLMKMTQDKEEVIGKLKEEIDLLNRDLDDIEDENEQLKQENKTLLKIVGQLTSRPAWRRGSETQDAVYKALALQCNGKVPYLLTKEAEAEHISPHNYARIKIINCFVILASGALALNEV